MFPRMIVTSRVFYFIQNQKEVETDGVAITETKGNLPDQVTEIAEPLKEALAAVNNEEIDGSDANRNLNADKKSISSKTLLYRLLQPDNWIFKYFTDL
jgi:hypothetical protein